MTQPVARPAYERAVGLPYHQVLLGGRPGWWRYVVGVLVVGLGMMIVAPFLLLFPFALWFLADGQDLIDSLDRLLDLSDPTPLGLAYLNLALALAMDGARVGLLDADIYGPSQPRMMGLQGERPVSKDGRRIEPLEAYGVKVISIGFLIEEEQPMVWRGPMVLKKRTAMVGSLRSCQ